MKKRNITAFVLGVITTAAMVSCGGKRDPGRVYMPDMGGTQTGGYSRAYETYALLDSTKFITDAYKRGGNMIFYNSLPVQGTLRRGDLFPYTIVNDSNGYKMSAAIKSPLTSPLDAKTLAEAGRLFNINCAICHGEKGTANGPIADKIGAVANLTQPAITGLSDGTMFHVMTYGKNNMGSYASQLTKLQRWQIIKYVRTLQGGTSPAGADSTASRKGADSSVVAKKA